MNSAPGEPNDKNLAASIGGLTQGVTVLDMAGAYSAFANHGIYTKPVAVVKVIDRKGKVIYENKPETKQVLSERTATLLTSMLQDVIARGTGTGAKINCPAAGKTGTTDDYQDAWFAGYTPNLVTVVWMGCDDNAQMPGVTGGTIPAKIWQNFMNAALQNVPAKNFDGSDTSISNPVTSVESEKETTTRERRSSRDRDNTPRRDEQHQDGINEQHRRPVNEATPDEQEPAPEVGQSYEQEAVEPERQNIPAPSIQQGKGLN